MSWLLFAGLPDGSEYHPAQRRISGGEAHRGERVKEANPLPVAGRVAAYARNKRGSCDPLYADCSSPGIFCRQKALFGISRNGIGRSPAGNEDFNNRVAAQTVAAMDAAGHLASCVQAGAQAALKG